MKLMVLQMAVQIIVLSNAEVLLSQVSPANGPSCSQLVITKWSLFLPAELEFNDNWKEILVKYKYINIYEIKNI